MDQTLGKLRDALERGLTVATPVARKATRLAGQATGAVVTRIQRRVSSGRGPAGSTTSVPRPRAEAPPPPAPVPEQVPVAKEAQRERVTPAKVAPNIAKHPPAKKPRPKESPSGKLPPRKRAPAGQD